MAKLFRKGKMQKIVAIVLGLVSVAGAVFGVVKLSKHLKEETKKITPTYTVGSLDETTGKANKDDKTSLYTKDSFSAKGLEVILDFDANVTYQVFWYDSLGEFAYATEEYSAGAEIYAPYNHTARVEITPVWDNTEEDEENEIKWYETVKYSSQLEIRVNKEQSLKKSDYDKFDLSHAMWYQKNDMYFEPSSGEYVDVKEAMGDNYSDYPPVRCYSWTNDGTRSAMYVDSFTPTENGNGIIYGLHIRLLDGTVFYSYSSEDTSVEVYAKDQELPTFENPMEFPKGATVYLWAHFDVDEAKAESETILCFY